MPEVAKQCDDTTPGGSSRVHLFSPIKIGSMQLINRIAIPPMCQYHADDGCANDWHIMHLGTLSNSGAGLIVLEATAVERIGRITHGDVGLYSDRCETALSRILSHCKSVAFKGVKFGIQLAHAGRKASAQLPWDGGNALKRIAGEEAWDCMAPSALAFGSDWPVPRAMTLEDIERVKKAFVSAAERAVRIGLDCIELHFAHGYLVHQFVSPVSNKRDDEYGGSFENRSRLAREIATAVRAVVPAHIPLGARFFGCDWAADGLQAEDSVAFAKMLQECGVDYVCVSSGGIVSECLHPLTPGYNVPIAEKVRREAGVLTRSAGLIKTAEQANDLVVQGKLDIVGVGRAFLDDPHWGFHAAEALGLKVHKYMHHPPSLWHVLPVEQQS